jgi:hypothetical protein
VLASECTKEREHSNVRSLARRTVHINSDENPGARLKWFSSMFTSRPSGFFELKLRLAESKSVGLGVMNVNLLV